MKTLTVIIEHCDKNLSAYIDGLPLVVVGANLDEIRDNIKEALEVYKEEIPSFCSDDNYSLEFKFDIKTLLNYYTRIFSFVALERLTGINSKQLCHYASGLKKPREQQRLKIEKALHSLGNELLSVSL